MFSFVHANLRFWENSDSVQNVIFLTSFSMGNELEKNKENQDEERITWKKLETDEYKIGEVQNLDSVIFDI